ncbi:hypothetical protein NC651_008683 [Populus alba x Populus x berolinensis]|nr:hypothetical protein NC651_008683 [Populus alba x Populus x berolinensis]
MISKKREAVFNKNRSLPHATILESPGGDSRGGERRINWGKKAFKTTVSRIWWEIEMTFLDPARNNAAVAVAVAVSLFLFLSYMIYPSTATQRHQENPLKRKL